MRHLRLFRLTLSIIVLLAVCTLSAPVPPPAAPTTQAAGVSAPVIIDYLPRPGEELSPGGAVTITFDQPMDPVATQAAVTVVPGLPGRFAWSDNNTTLSFTPDTLERQVHYTVTVGASAASRMGQALPAPFSFSFASAGFLEVGQVLPAPDAQDADPSTAIVVAFNRPVVPLTVAGEPADLPAPLQLTPTVAGTGAWLGTSIYVFRPQTPFAPGSAYTALVKAGLRDVQGNPLQSDYTWTFKTLPAKVLAVSPGDATTGVALTTPISVTFSQRMDHASTEAAFYLYADEGPAMTGTFHWQTDPLQGPQETLGFWPAARLRLDTRYRLGIRTGAKVLSGTAAIDPPWSGSFATVPLPAIRATEPQDGDLGADPWSGLELRFASPMDPATVMPHVAILPRPTRIYTSTRENHFYILWDMQPSTAYTVTLAPGMCDVYGNALTGEQIVHFTTRAYPPRAYLWLQGGAATLNDYDPPRVFVEYLNVSELHFALYRLSLDDLARAYGQNYYGANWSAYQPQRSDLVREWRQPAASELNTDRYREIPLVDASGRPLGAGLYYLTFSTPETTPMSGAVVVTHISLMLKVAQRESLVWATDLRTGRPIADVPVALYWAGPDGAAPLAQGRTDASGVWQGDAVLHDDVANGRVFAVLRSGGPEGFALSVSRWDDGLEPWRSGINPTWSRADYAGYVYTDRPLYRPGQTVYFKAVLRADDDLRYSLPPQQTVLARVVDDREQEVYRTTLPLSPYGTVSGEVALAGDLTLGNYHILVALPDHPEYTPEFGVAFQVAAYRKPEFQVLVSADPAEILDGAHLHVVADARYFFGGAVAGASVHYTVVASPYTLSWPGPGHYDFGGGPTEPLGSGANVVAEGDGQTDAAGRFTLDLPADLSRFGSSQVFAVEVAVTDLTQQQVAGRTQVTVHRSERYVGLAPARQVGHAGQPQTVNLVTVDWHAQPAGGQALEFSAWLHSWYCAQREDGNTGRHWECTPVDTPVLTTTLTTDEHGQAAVTFTPTQGGIYSLRVRGIDASGHALAASAYLWVAGGDYVTWRQDDGRLITLVADRARYKPGDTAEILIASPFDGETTALITVERGRVLQHEVLTLAGNSTVYRLAVRPEYAPNVYVSVVLVRGGQGATPAQYRAGLVRLDVSDTHNELKVTITPDRETVGPRDTVTYTVRVADQTGRPVQAEISAAIVDLAVLSLRGPNSGPILQSFYATRGLGVRTAGSLVVALDATNLMLAPLAESKGGGGGEGGPSVRADFLDTAYWKADLVTNLDGVATFAVTLPDNLTTWRLDVRAITTDTLAGQTSLDVVATKPLLISPVTPRFFVAGDTAQLSAVVHNNTAQPLTGTAELLASGVTLAGAAAQSVSLPPGGRARVTWLVTVQDVPAVALTFRVAAGGLIDASKPPLGQAPDRLLPVYRYTAPEIVGTSGMLTEPGSRTEVIALPRRFEASQGELVVNVAPSLAAPGLEGLRALEQFPYECIEQTISRFAPNVVTYQALKRLKVSDAALESRLPVLVTQGLQRLYAAQHADGGWGWFVSDESDPALSAYALFGLAQAERAGFPVDGPVKSRAVAFLQAHLQAPQNVTSTAEADRQAWLLYALAVAGQGDTGRIATWYDARQKLDHYARAYLALALLEVAPDEPTRPQSIASDLAGSAVLTSSGAHWEEPEDDPWSLNTDTRSTAIILDLLARVDPQSPLTASAARWLVVARQGDAWRTTQETAWSVIALADYLAATGGWDAHYDWSVTLNAQPLGAGTALSGTLRETTQLSVPLADLLPAGANRLVLERGDGPGQLAYTAYLRAFLPAGGVGALSHGITIEREYTLAPSADDRRVCIETRGADARCQPRAISRAQVGDVVQVWLTLVVPHDVYYVYVEDPLPAGVEAVDTSLLTTPRGIPGPQLVPQARSFVWGAWRFGHTELRDEKTVLFARTLPAGTYVYTYQIRTTLPGEFNVLPAEAREFYAPETWGRTGTQAFEVHEK
jgi:uncharacterized protein YfaS (alpha-2-macroglobulin family)